MVVAMMTHARLAAAATILTLFLSALTGTAPARADTAAENAVCPLDRQIVLAGLDWDSARFHNAVAARILQDAYGCDTTEIAGATIPLTNGLARGDVDIMMEVWRNSLAEAWVKAAETGRVRDIGPNFPDAVQGWYVPRYVVEGPDAPAPDLRSVADLANYTELFRDREEPGKGRFYNCLAGWACEIVNTRKLEAYGLADLYTNFKPGTGEALTAAVIAATRRKKPILFYHWTPSWLLGAIDAVKLDEPPFDAEAFDALRRPDAPLPNGVAYPVASVAIGVNSDFANAAPELISMLTAYETTSDLVAGALLAMEQDKLSAEEAADGFLKANARLWQGWMPAPNAARLSAALGLN